MNPGYGFAAGGKAVRTAWPAFYPESQASLNGWWRAPDYSAGLWTATASLGNSLGNGNLSEGTNYPAVGLARNGYAGADFDGTNDRLHNNTFADSIFAAAEWCMAVVFRARTWNAYGTDEYDNTGIVTTTGAATAAIGMALSASGVSVYHAAGGGWPGVTCPLAPWAPDGIHLARSFYDGTNIYLDVDGTGWASVAAANADQLGAGEQPRVGTNWDESKFLDGIVWEVMLGGAGCLLSSKSAMDSLKNGYFNPRYKLSF